MTRAGAKVVVAMSGGVDSSVAAALLLREGFEVVGCFMRLGSPDGHGPEGLVPDADGACGLPTAPEKPARGCCSVGDAHDARLVAAELGVPFYVCNFRRDFGRVMDYFADEYAAGRTPNPCVRCNDWLKFGRLHEHASRIGARFIASGHYARIDRTGGRARLLRGLDRAKDQSYVLFGASPGRLDEMLLPIGGFEKDRVRDMAERFGLPVFDKPDSQEICFVPDDDYAGFVERRRPETASPGRFIDESGAVLGEHRGQHHFTVGQRRGLSLSADRPLYVLSRDASTNTVVVGDRERLAVRRVTARDVKWLADDASGDWTLCAAQWRAHGVAAPARARIVRTGEAPTLEIEFDEPQHAVAPGQAIVCYRDDVVLGGGWIERADRA